jgi:3'-5' exoribonuclease
MRMYYLIELSEYRQTKTGKDYLFIQGNTGEKREQLYVWGAPTNVDHTKLRYNVLSVSKVKEMDGFVSLNWMDCVLTKIEDLPEGHAIRAIKLKGDYDNKSLWAFAEKMAEKWNFPLLWKRLINSQEFHKMTSGYQEVCAGRSVHHPWVNGLSTHTQEAAMAADKLLELEYFKAKPWIVLLSIFFHDWGKLVEYKPISWEYTSQMYLKGHVYISAKNAAEFLTEYVKTNFSAMDGVYETYAKDIEHIEHCILAHHGLKEYGSPVVPATIEAYVVTTCDLISARTDMFTRSLDNEKNFYLGTTVQKL